MKIHLIHGIYASEDDAGIKKLHRYFRERGYATVFHYYGREHILTARWRNPGHAARIAEKVGKDDILVGHSNGCTVAWMISNMVPVRGLILINGALNRDIPFTLGLDWVQVYYNTDDKVVWLSRWIPFNLWGKMGNSGYTGFDGRVQNFNCIEIQGMPEIHGHNDIFSKDHIDPWANFIVDRMEEELRDESSNTASC